jgi:hypothetical protein
VTVQRSGAIGPAGCCRTDGPVLVLEVQRHLHRDLLIGGHALEVDVLDDRLVRVPLHIAQQHALGLAVEFHVEDRRVEGFDTQGVVERVVIEFDLAGLAIATVDDAGDLGGTTQAAARTRTLQLT